jgi:hypothetical protein
MAQVRVAADEALATGEHIGLGANGATRAERSSSFGMVLDEAGPNGLVWALLGAL